MKKKWLCVIMATAVAVSSAACGSKPSASGSATTPSSTEGMATTTEEAEKAKETQKETAMKEASKEETTAKESSEEETKGQEPGTSDEKDSGGEVSFQTGTWDGLTFTNPWLNLTIPFPEDSYVYTEEEMKAVLGAGQDVLINNGTYTESQLALAEALTVYDFMVTLPDGNSNVQIAYENVKLTTGGKGIKAEDYLKLVSSQLSSITDMKYQMDDVSQVEIAGQAFAKLSATLMDGAFCQDYYCINVGDRMATITVSYLPESVSVVEELIQGITKIQ